MARSSALPSPSEALPGRADKMPVASKHVSGALRRRFSAELHTLAPTGLVAFTRANRLSIAVELTCRELDPLAR